MRYLISGYYGEKNVGDEAILAGILQEIDRRDSAASFTVLSFDPDDTKRRHGTGHDLKALSTSLSSPARLRAAMKAADLLISGGGSFLHEADFELYGDSFFFRAGKLRPVPYFLSVVQMAHSAGLPVMWYAQGLGPLHTRAARLLVAGVGSASQVVTWRDQGSARLAYEVGVRAPVQLVVPDPAYALDPAPAVEAQAELARSGLAPGTRYLIVCPRPWLGRTGYLDHLGEALEKVGSALGLAIVLVPLHEVLDKPVCETLAARPGFAGRARSLPPVTSPALLAAILGGAELVVSMRLHGGILAAIAGTPAVIIDYDPKTRAFAAQTGQTRWTVTVDDLEGATGRPDGVAALVEAIMETAATLPARRAALARAVAPLRSEAGRTARMAVQLASQSASRKSDVHSRFRRPGAFSGPPVVAPPAAGRRMSLPPESPLEPPVATLPPGPSAPPGPSPPALASSPATSPAGFSASDPGRSVRSVVGKAAIIIVCATLVGRILGLVRDVVVAYFFGAQADTDAFFLAYKLPYLLVFMVGGALTATFVPLFSHRLATGRKREAWDLSVNIGNLICVVLIVVSVALVVLAPWIVPLIGFGFTAATAGRAVFLFRILMIGLVFDGIAGLVVGMLNSLRRFALAAFAPAVGTAVTLVVTVALAHSLGIAALAVGSVLGSVAGLATLLPGIRDQGIRYRPRIDWHDPGLREVGAMVWPILIGSAVGKLGIFGDQILGSMLEVGSISSLSYAEKLFQIPLGLFVAGITVPIFPLLSEQVAANAPERVKATVNFSLRLMGFLLVPATVGIILLRYPIIGLIFEHGRFTAADTTRTAWAFLFLSLGLYVFAGRDTLTRVFYAYRDPRTPVKISVATVLINVGLSYLFMQFLGVGGLALGTTVALAINFVVLIWLLRRKIGPVGFGRTFSSLLRVTGVSAVMGAVVWTVDHFLSGDMPATTGGNAVRVVVGVVVGAGVFLLVSRLVKMPELAEITDMLRAVLKRTARRPAGQDPSG